MIYIINFELYIIKMKRISLLLLAATSVANCLDIMGIELPEPERLSKQER